VDVDLTIFPPSTVAAATLAICSICGAIVLEQVVQGPFVERSSLETVTRETGDIGDVELTMKVAECRAEAVENLGDALHHLHLADVNVRTPVEPDLTPPMPCFATTRHARRSTQN